MSFAPPKSNLKPHLLSSSNFYQTQTAPKFSNKNYKSRKQLHAVRKVSVPKDSKDVKFKSNSGSQNSVPQNVVKIDAKPNKTVPRSRPLPKQDPKPGHFVTLTEDQFSKILGLLEQKKSTDLSTMQINANNNTTGQQVQNIMSDQTLNKVSTSVNESKHVKPEIVTIEKSEIPPVTVSKLVQQPPSNPTIFGHSNKPIAEISPRLRQTAIPMASSFKIGGDGAPNQNTLEERRRLAKQEWLKDLETQRLEQEKKKNSEKAANKAVSQLDPVWLNHDKINKVESDKSTKQNEPAKMEQAINNTPNSSSQKTFQDRPISTLQYPTKTSRNPSGTNLFDGTSKSAYQWTDPADEKKRAADARKRQQEDLRLQIEANKNLRLEALKIEKEKERLAEEKVKIEQELLNKKYSAEANGNIKNNDEISIAKALKKSLSPRQEEQTQITNSSQQIEPQNVDQPVSARSSSSQIVNVKLNESILKSLKTENGQIVLPINLDQLQLANLQISVQENALKNIEEKIRSESKASERDLKDVPLNKRTKSPVKKIKNQRKWGQSNNNERFIPASQKNLVGNESERQARIKQRQKDLIKQQQLNAKRIQKVTSKKEMEMEHDHFEKEPVQKNKKPITVYEAERPRKITSTLNIPNEIPKNTSDLQVINNDILKNRQRQQRILQEISQLRRGLAQKKNQIMNLE